MSNFFKLKNKIIIALAFFAVLLISLFAITLTPAFAAISAEEISDATDSSSYDVEVNSKGAAVLGARHFTVIENHTASNYAYNGYLPELFALSEDYAILINTDATDNVRLLDLAATKANSSLTFLSDNQTISEVADVCYANGYFFLAVVDGSTGKILRTVDSALSFTTVYTSDQINSTSLINVDISGNLYLGNTEGTEKNSVYIHKPDAQGNFLSYDGSAENKRSVLMVKKFFTDSDCNFYYLLSNGYLGSSDLGATNSRLGLSPYNKEVYFVKPDNTSVWYTNNLSNTSTALPAPLPTYSVTVENGTGGGYFEQGTFAEVTANKLSGKDFLKWTSNGVDISTSNPYTFSVTGDITLTAVYQKSIPSTTPTSVFYSPESELEYYELNSPIDIYYEDNLVAIIQSNQTLIIYNNGTFTRLTNFTALKQVKKLSENILLVSDNGKIYTIDLANSFAKTEYDASVGGNYFDINSNYLVTAFSTNAFIYPLENGTPNSADRVDLEVKDGSPIAIYGDTVYYIKSNNHLYYIKCDGSNETDVAYVGNETINCMVANGEYVYLTQSGTVYRLSITVKEKQELTANGYADYDLGNIVNAYGICFKDNNLLVADSTLSAVQEFKIENGALSFTGYAIAKGKTAFNRIGANNYGVDIVGSKIAVIDDMKLTLIDESADGETTYYNFLFKNLYSSASLYPTEFALGSQTVLLINSAGAKLLDLKTGTLGDSLITYQVFDSCYQNGNYYLTVNTALNPNSVCVIDEGGNISYVTIPTEVSIADGTLISVDVDGNLYIKGASSNIVTVYASGNYLTADGEFDAHNAVKLENDLSGSLFILSSDGKMYSYISGDYSTAAQVTDYTSNNFTSFCMTFDNGKVLFVKNGEEYIISKENIGNASVDKIIVPTDYTLNGSSANISNLKLLTVPNDVNAYYISDIGNYYFDYTEKITLSAGSYVLIDEIDDFYIIAGALSPLLIKKSFISGETQNCIIDTAKTVYTTTKVNLYFIPVITKNDLHCIITESNIYLIKGAEFSVLKSCNINGKTFYYGLVSINSVEYTGYIPANFTVDVLSENITPLSFTLEKVSASNVFSNFERTDWVAELAEGTTVKVLSTNDGVCYIEYETASGVSYGYVSASAIIAQSSVGIRNAIIITLVALAVGITAVFLVMKKKS